MIYLLSHRGRGWIGLPAIIFACLLGVGVAALVGKGEILWFGLAWVFTGIVLVVLGRRWNREANVHQFCGLAIQKWGWIFCGIGLFLAVPGYQGMRYGM